MANCFTHRNNYPRATTQKDQGATACAVHGWKMNQIRQRNKYPIILHEEEEPQAPKQSYRAERSMAVPARLFPASVNFTCGTPLPPRARGEIPDIKYDARSTQRTSYAWPVYPEGVPHERHFGRYGFFSDRPVALGIAPTAPAPSYQALPVLNYDEVVKESASGENTSGENTKATAK